MIVDKINTYLSENKLTLNERIAFEIEKMSGATFRRQFMVDSEYESKGKIRLSSVGKCQRQLAYSFHGFPKAGKEIDSRAKLIFWSGDLVEMTIVSLAKLAGVNLIGTGLNQITVNFGGEEGHTDGLVLESNELLLLEVKSMSSYSFEKFERGDIDESYIAQINLYMASMGLLRCVVVAMNKDNGVLHEMILKRDDVLVKALREKIQLIRASKPETLPAPAYEKDEKGFYPWQCLYCAFWKTCRTNAELVVVRNAYKLKEKIKEN